jgi:hypothetical protein
MTTGDNLDRAIEKATSFGVAGAVVVYALPPLADIPPAFVPIFSDSAADIAQWQDLVRDSRHSRATLLTAEADAADYVYGLVCRDVNVGNYETWQPNAFGNFKQLGAKTDQFARFLDGCLIGAIVNPTRSTGVVEPEPIRPGLLFSQHFEHALQLSSNDNSNKQKRRDRSKHKKKSNNEVLTQPVYVDVLTPTTSNTSTSTSTTTATTTTTATNTNTPASQEDADEIERLQAP